MLRIKQVLILLGLVSLVGFAQPGAGYSILSDPTKLVDQFIRTNKKTSTIYARFEQVNKSSLLENVVSSKGELWFKANDKFLLKYDGKVQNTLIFANGYLIKKEGKKTQKINMNASKTMKQVYELIISSMNGDIIANKKFKVTYYSSNSHYLLWLEPMDSYLKKGILSIEILIDKETLYVSSFKIIQPSGDYSNYIFSDVAYNRIVSDSLFLLNTR